jgi:DNA topoisomerase I
VQRGNPDDEEEKPQNASLLKGMTPENVDLETALKLLTLPRNLGDHPQQGVPVMAFNGRYGPYVKCGDETRSLPADESPLDVTLDQAVALLAQPKTRGRQAAAKREPIKVFEKSPVTENPVQLLDGRYGPYVTDGETNASLPKGSVPEELTFNEALDLLAARAAAGPSKKRGKKSTKKTAAPKKKATKRKTPTTKSAKSAKRKG